MFKYPFLSGIFLPFKIFQPAKIYLKRGVKFELGSRLTLGNSIRNSAIVSQLPINIYLGENAAVRLGHSVFIGPGVNLIVKKNANLYIGNSTYFTSDMHLEVLNSISIGNDCAISWGVTIIDDDHHEIIFADKKNVKPGASVVIGDKVWIGCNVTILKGTRIGNNCVVAAGSIVKGVFPDNTLIAGNPAKIVKENIDWK